MRPRSARAAAAWRGNVYREPDAQLAGGAAGCVFALGVIAHGGSDRTRSLAAAPQARMIRGFYLPSRFRWRLRWRPALLPAWDD